MQPDRDRDSTGLLWSWGGGDTEGNESERLDTRVYTTDIHDTHITSMDTPHKINKDKIGACTDVLSFFKNHYKLLPE